MTSPFDQVWKALTATVESGRMPGAVAGIRHNGATEVFATGKLAFERERAMAEDTQFRIASLSKPLAGAIAAAMIADGSLGLGDPVETWLPELNGPRVLIDPAGALDKTVPSARPITTQHLLTNTHGLGVIFDKTPLSQAMIDMGVAAGAIPPQLSADDYMARMSDLPLAYQPGERWMYNTGADILSVLLSRVSGMPLHDLVSEYVTLRLRMTSTAFSGSNLPTEYSGTTPYAEMDGIFEKEPPFESLAGGLVSTVPDYLAFLSALADGKLIPDDVRASMTSDQLTPAQRVGTELLLGPTTSWGWQVGVTTSGTAPGKSAGSYGWTGGTGTMAFVDPSHDLIGVVFTQRMMAGPQDSFDYFMDPLASLT